MLGLASRRNTTTRMTRITAPLLSNAQRRCRWAHRQLRRALALLRGHRPAARARRSPGGLRGGADKSVGPTDEIAQSDEHARIVDVVIGQVVCRRILFDQQVP